MWCIIEARGHEIKKFNYRTCRCLFAASGDLVSSRSHLARCGDGIGADGVGRRSQEKALRSSSPAYLALARNAEHDFEALRLPAAACRVLSRISHPASWRHLFCLDTSAAHRMTHRSQAASTSLSMVFLARSMTTCRPARAALDRTAVTTLVMTASLAAVLS